MIIFRETREMTTLTGGIGDDAMDGGAGNDTYVFGRGSSQDVIIDSDGSTDIIQFAGDVTPADVTTVRLNNDLYFIINDTGDILEINGWFTNDSNKIELIQFGDGTVWDGPSLTPMIVQEQGSNGNDTLTGADDADIIIGLEGNDTISGRAGNDILYGGEGSDSLSGDEGDDILKGGSGNDSLFGGGGNNIIDGGSGNDVLAGDAGDDTFVFGKGSGQDSAWDLSGTDIVSLAADITPADIFLGRNDFDLVLRINETGDTMTIPNWFEDMNKIESIQFSDGTVWGVDDIKQLGLQGTEGDDILIGYETDDTIDGLGGNDTIIGGGGNDIIDGGEGNDSIFGSEGNDTVDGGAGDDYIADGTGDDILTGGEGNDSIIGGAGKDTIQTGDGINTADGRSGSDTIITEGISNEIKGGTGRDTISGGTGDDTFIFNMGDGLDSLSDSGGEDAVVMGTGINFDNTVIRIDAGIAHLRLLDEEGEETYHGMDITLNPDGSFPVETVSFADGTSFTPEELVITSQTLYGTDGNDTIYGDDRNDDTIYARGGDDAVFAGGGNDRVYGEDGNDYIEGNAGNDILDGGSGDDYLDGGTGNDTLMGGEGTDVLIGGRGINQLDGGAGDDALYGGTGANTYFINRGNGFDTITVESSRSIRYADLIVKAQWHLELIAQFADGNYGFSGDNPFPLLTSDFPAELREQFDAMRDVEGLPADEAQAAFNSLMAWLNSGDTSDTLVFGPGIMPNNITVNISAAGAPPKIAIGFGNDESVLIQGSFSGVEISDLVLKNFVFADGQTLTLDEIIALAGNGVIDPWSGESADTLLGSVAPDTIYANGGNDTIDSGAQDDWIQAGAGDDLVNAGSGADGVAGEEGNDVIAGGRGDDTIFGGNGDDLLQGDEDNDCLVGEAGNDTLIGGEGNDAYIFARGYGQDIIMDSDITAGNMDTIFFDGDVQPSEIGLRRNGDDLVFSINGTDDTLTVSGWFAGDENKIEQVKFADGTIWDAPAIEGMLNAAPVISSPLHDQIAAQGTPFSLTLPADTFTDEDITNGGSLIYSATLADGSALPSWLTFDAATGTFSGMPGLSELGVLPIKITATDAGGLSTDLFFNLTVANMITGDNYNNTINGTAGLDYIQAGAGNDTVNAGDGNDIIDGGAGSDVLSGGSGDDTFLINGIDTSYDRFQGDAGYDVIQGGSGDDTIRVNNFAGNYTVEKIDGGLGTNVLSGTQYNDVIDLSGTDLVNIVNIDGGAGNDTITGSSGNDTIIGGAGSDVLAGGAGNDTYFFGIGGGTDTINDYDTTDGNEDTVQLGVNPLDLIFSESGNNLTVGINGTTDKVTIQNWSSDSANTIEVYRAADGSQLLGTEVDQLIQAMAAFSAGSGMSWSEAIQQKPQEVQALLAQYWSPQG